MLVSVNGIMRPESVEAIRKIVESDATECINEYVNLEHITPDTRHLFSSYNGSVKHQLRVTESGKRILFVNLNGGKALVARLTWRPCIKAEVLFTGTYGTVYKKFHSRNLDEEGF